MKLTIPALILTALVLALPAPAAPPEPSCSYADGQISFVDFPKNTLRLLVVDADTLEVEAEIWVLTKYGLPLTVDEPTDPTIYHFESFNSGKLVAECLGG